MVTGIGLVSPLGIGTEETWAGIQAGRSGAGPITLFDASLHNSRFGAEVKDFEPTRWVEKKDVKKMDRFIQFAVAAADIAMEDAHYTIAPGSHDMTGVYIGSGIGGFATIEREHETLLKHGVLSKDTHGTVARFAPALIIEREQIDWGVARIRDALREYGPVYERAA